MFNVNCVGDRVEFDFVMKPNGRWPAESDIRTIVKNIFEVTGVKFNIASDSWSYSEYPFLNVYVFHNKSAYKFQWNISDTEMRSKFVVSLEQLRTELQNINYISKDDVSVATIVNSVITTRDLIPLVSIGSSVYQLNLIKVESTPFDIGDHVRAEITKALLLQKEEANEALRVIKNIYDSELEILKSKDSRPFPVNAKDFFNGWRTWIKNGTPCLGKQFTFEPKYITDGKNTYPLKSEISKTYKSAGILYYTPDGFIWTQLSNGNRLITHHTRSSGDLCTGDISVSKNLSYENTKILILKVIETLSIVNIHSMTRNELSEKDAYPINSISEIPKYCNGVISSTSSRTLTPVTTSEITDGEII